MPPRTSIGLVQLTWLLFCAFGITFAKTGTTKTKLIMACDNAPDVCDRPSTNILGPIKCQRCNQQLGAVMNEVQPPARTELKTQNLCNDIIHDWEKPYLHHPARPHLDKNEACTRPENLLYDASFECKCGSGGLISKCSKKLNFYECLCQGNFTNADAACLHGCFQHTPPPRAPDMHVKCPKALSRFNNYTPPKKSNMLIKDRYARPPSKKKQVQRSEEDDTDNNPEDDPEDDLEDDIEDDLASPFPPDLDNQFSPVLKDRELAFYIDADGLCIFVDPDTYEVLYYEPYVLYELPYYDEESQDESGHWGRRCYLYPYSDRVWCWEFPISEEAYNEYAAVVATMSVSITDAMGNPASYTTDTYIPDATTAPNSTPLETAAASTTTSDED